MAIASAAILPTWRSLDEAAEQTGIGRRTLTRWVSEGKLRAYARAGDRKRYVDLDDIRKLQELAPIETETLGAKVLNAIKRDGPGTVSGLATRFEMRGNEMRTVLDELTAAGLLRQQRDRWSIPG
jgi:excisionase family DNA binding protein